MVANCLYYLIVFIVCAGCLQNVDHDRPICFGFVEHKEKVKKKKKKKKQGPYRCRDQNLSINLFAVFFIILQLKP